MKKLSILFLSFITLLIISCSNSSTNGDNPIITPPPTTPPPSEIDSLQNPLLIPVENSQIVYYKEIDFSIRGLKLKNQLSQLLEKTHKHLNYTTDIWEASMITYINSDNPNEVFLIYGWIDKTEKEITQKRTMNKERRNHGGFNDDRRKNLWEREHVFAKSLAVPKLITYGSDEDNMGLIAGTDAHNLRPVNGEWNNARSNKKFVEGSGNSGSVNGGWYPGDEWKGDVARMMMYMFVRYGNQCRPDVIGKGKQIINVNTGERDGMIDLFLKWNAEDPVSDLEKKRNEYHGNKSNMYAQGNRNPFIDNPYLANAIWGAEQEYRAENLWTTKEQHHTKK
jgi:endonuclease I